MAQRNEGMAPRHAKNAYRPNTGHGFSLRYVSYHLFNKKNIAETVIKTQHTNTCMHKFHANMGDGSMCYE